MTPEEFVVWLRGYVVEQADRGIFPIGSSPQAWTIVSKLSTVVIKTQPPQPGVPGVLGQGLVRLEKPNSQVQLDSSEVPVFRGGGCQ